MAIIRNFRLPVGIGLSADYIETFGVIESLDPNTGAIVSKGGVGIGNSISIGGRLQLFNGNYFAAFDFTGSASTVYILPSSSPATGSSVLQSTSAGVMSWVPMTATSGAASGFTTLNSITSGIQFFATGTSGSGFNISSSGSTHTFNIPIAGSGTTGLITTLAQTIAGTKTFTSAIIGDLSGTATTAGFATTASYSYQSGYATTSGSSSSWTSPRTLNLSGDLSGSVLWSGSGDTTLNATIVANSVALGTDTTGQFASTIVISGSGITASTTNIDDGTAYTIYSSATSNNVSSTIVSRDGSGNFSAGNITANLTGTASTSTYSHQAGYAITAGSSSTATTATYAQQSGYGITAGLATTSTYSHQSGYGLTAGSASIATTATYSHQAGYAITSGSSGSAITAFNVNLVSANTNSSHPVIFSPSSSGSGVALSSNTTLSYNPSTNILSTSGFAVTASTASTSSSTGALVITGGVGIGGSLYVASATAISGVTINNGIITGNLTGTATTAGFATTSSYSNQSGYGITAGLATTATYSHQAGYAITSGSSNTSGYATTAGLATTSTNVNVIAASTNASHPVLFTPTSGSASGIAVSSNGTLVYNPSTDRLSTSGLAVTATTASTSSTSGALVVTGGVGIGGSLYVAGDLTINGTTTTINSVTLTVDDKNIELGSVSSPSDVTAEGGGITLKGATDKSINWYTGTGWSSSESWNLSSGNTYKINNTTVLSNSSIGTGITNSSLTALGTISTGVWSGTLITAFYGGTGLNSYTKGDLLVGAGTTLIKHAVGSQNQILTADLFSGSGLSWATFANPTYGSFYSTSTQQVAGAGISTPIKFNATYESNRVSIFGGAGTSSRIQIQDAGPFSITFSAQINLVTGNAPSKGEFWFRVNGQDIPQSNSSMSINGKDFETVLTVNFVYTFANNDYFEIYMASNDTHFSIEYKSTNPPRPNTPSVILSVLPITHIVGASGSGISGILSLNGSTASQQYFLTGTSGTGFNVSTASGNHTFNIPIAGSGATGLVTGIAQTFDGSKTFSANTIISSSTASTTTTTGALIVSGGVGIGQSASISGRLQLFNGANYAAFVSSATGNTVYTLPATSPATGTSVLQSTSAGVLSWVALTASGNTTQNVVINTAGNVNVFHPILFTPSSLSAGSAVSSDSTITFNPSTEILNVSGLAITSGTASTNTTTGALVVRGGLGVTGQLSFATASFGFTGIATNPSMSFIGATTSSPITLTVLTDNSLNFEGSQGSVFSIDSNLSSGEIFSVSDISGLPIISASAGQTVNINEFGGYTQIGNGSINSSSTTTGSLVIAGGLGFTGNAFIGGTTTISNGVNSTSTGSGSLVVRGGIGVTGNAFIGGTTSVTSTTNSTNIGSGALVVSGGVGIGQSASIGGRLQMFNGANYTAFVSSASGNTVYTLPATSPATGSSVLISSSAGVWSWASLTAVGYTASGAADGTVQFKSGSGFAGTNSLFFDTNLLGLRVSGFPGGNTPSSTDAVLKLETNIGSFNGSVNGTYIAVNAPTGFTGDLMNLQVNAVSRFRIDNTGAATAGTFNFSGTSSITNGLNSSSTTTGTLTVAGGVGITGNTFVGGTATFTNGTNSSSTTTGALQVRGGLGITGNAFIGGTTSITNTTASTSISSGALNVSGGVGIGQTLFVGGSISNANYFYSGGNNFTKSGQAQGDILLDNNANDTPGVLYYYKNNTNFGTDVFATGTGSTRYRIVRDLNESGGSELWSIDRTGVVTRTAWAPGEIIKMTVLVGADLTGGSTTTISTSSDTDVASYSYTPVSSSSYLVIEFTTRYFVVGAAADDYVSRIAVDGAEQSFNVQVWTNGAGGGTRSGTLFPLMARYTNSNTTAKTISATVRKGTTDDNATVYKDTTTVMKITEIGR